MISLTEARNLAIQLAPELAASDLVVIEQQPDWPKPPGAAYAIGPRTIVFAEPPTVEVLLHEAAHLLPAKPAPDLWQDLLVEQPEFTAYMDRSHTRAVTREGVDPWHRHGADWIRRVLHLVHRAERIGISIRYPHLNAAGDCYELSDLWLYRSALNCEPYRFVGRTFAEIEAAETPETFSNLFARDVARWHCLNHSPRS